MEEKDVMIKGLKPYRKYKDSGVPWLGKVPAHWDTVHLKRVVSTPITDGPHETPELVGDGIEFVSAEAMVNGRIDFSKRRGYVSHKEHERFCKKLKPQFHDIFMCKSGATTGKVVIVDVHREFSVWSPMALIRANCKYATQYFLFYTLQSSYIQDQVRTSWSAGTQPNLSMEDMKVLFIMLPSVEEQQAIVRFLDWAERRIRKAIRLRQKRIKLLEEYKQALIHQAVTGQIDVTTGKPYPEYKDSGVEWLGKVPAHWEVRRVKQITRILRGKFTHRPRNDPSLYDGSYPFIQTGEVARASKSITTYNQTLSELGLSVSKMFPAGTLVMTIAANIGDVAVLEFEACFPDSIVGFVPRNEIQRDYLFYLFRSMKQELLREAPVNTQGNLNIDRIGSMRIPVPSITEQEKIVELIEVQKGKIDSSISATHRAIELLKELRTTLIAEVVTGKLDVREAADHLPEEPQGEVEEMEEEPVEAQEAETAAETFLEEEADE